MSIFSILFSIAASIMTWSFAEYFLHNFVGHQGKGKNKFSREHLNHHADVTYFASSFEKAKATVIVTSIMAPISIFLVDAKLGITYTLSFVSFYLIYEFIHRRIHTHPPKTKYGKWARKHHMYHHFFPKLNHGVTSPIWDIVFRTIKVPEIVKVSPKNVMEWLCDENGNVKEEFSKDYQVIEAKLNQKEIDKISA